jgi:hypothetical protein
MYQVFVKLSESRNADMRGPVPFATLEERAAYVRSPAVFWYHFAEDEDWFLWRRGGAWAATHQPGPADAVPEEPEITDDDRW